MRISVCLTTYNRASQLDYTLSSLARQTRLPDELIVSDDCSSDHTAEIVEKWQKHFPQLFYQRNAQNLNMPGNLNAAVSRARGDYIANLHDADEYHPRLLEKWAHALDTFPSAGFVFAGVVNQRGQNGEPDDVTLHDVAPFTPGRAFFEKYYLHRWSSIVWGTVMACRSAYVRLLPFDEAYGFISDVDMCMRMCLYYDVAYVREPLIILDQSPTKERGFRWSALDATRRMQKANIIRFYTEQPGRLHRELVFHYLQTQRHYLRGLLGGLLHKDLERFYNGFAACRQIGWPLKVLGHLSDGE